jgi:hypothetical protein
MRPEMLRLFPQATPDEIRGLLRAYWEHLRASGYNGVFRFSKQASASEVCRSCYEIRLMGVPHSRVSVPVGALTAAVQGRAARLARGR